MEEKLETAEKIAVMTEVEVCELISKKYEVVYSEIGRNWSCTRKIK